MASPSLQPQGSAELEQQMAVVRSRVRSGANWFIIIGALSVINTIISMSGGGMRFIFGLGITGVADAIGHQGGGASQGVTLLLSVFFAAFIAMFGLFARKEQKWAFFVGLGLYVCDALLLLPLQAYLDAAFHAWALFRIFQGLQALNALEQLKAQEATTVGAVSASWGQ